MMILFCRYARVTGNVANADDRRSYSVSAAPIVHPRLIVIGTPIVHIQ